MKLWNKGESTDKKMDCFTVGNDRQYDLVLAPYDCQASIAHAKMLQSISILDETEVQQVINTLNELQILIKQEKFIIEDTYEDIHSKLEHVLTKKHGTLGKKIHTGRSRNDQVLVAFQLYIKDQIDLQIGLIQKLFELLLDLAERHEKKLMPGYTHMQVAMPSSFGLWFSAYAESLIDDVILLVGAKKIADQNPLGSAAGYGTGFDIDRKFTTKELDFSEIRINPIAVQMGREKISKAVLDAIGSIGSTLSKFCFDLCLYLGQEHRFISLSGQMTTGSSIMPHKKNPDIFELIRGKCNVLKTSSHQLNLLCSNLPSGYHRDLQLSKGMVIEAFDELTTCLEMMIHSLNEIQVHDQIIEDSKYTHLFSVNTLENWVKDGMPFREAYNKMVSQIQNGIFKADKKLNHTHIGSIGNLSIELIRNKMEQCIE
ncbi:MAG: argininosuccinate lyase [Flavobacteriaceae bacterium]|nr:argininosuccinate lyase [Flavobacteriaceae bacterium]MCY4266307.1 argininosuccinate lyase [Flavobacteriaceae bacterium]